MSNISRDLGAAFAAANPQLNSPNVRARISPAVGSVSGCADATRTVIAGGAMGQMLMHPSFVPFQLTFRKLPDDGVYNASKTRQYAFEIGSFTVPTNMTLAVAEYSFLPYRLSGIAPGEAVPLEPGRLSLDVAYDLNISQTRKGNIKTELIPQLPSPSGNAFLSSPTVGGGSESFNVNVKSGLSNFGDGLMIQDFKKQQGPEKFPFTYYVNSNQAVQMRVIVFDTITIPIAFFEAVLSGYLMPQNTLESMLEGVAPCHK